MGASRVAQEKSLKTLSRKEPTNEERLEVMRKTFLGAPIETALLGVAVLDMELERLIRLKLKRSDKDTIESITGADGPIHTTAQKIRLAYAMGLIDRITERNLTRAKNIRNQFAHAKVILSFENELIQAEMRKVEVGGGRRSEIYKWLKNARKGSKNKQLDFVLFCEALCNQLTARQRRYHSTSFRNKRRAIGWTTRPKSYLERMAELLASPLHFPLVGTEHSEPASLLNPRPATKFPLGG